MNGRPHYVNRPASDNPRDTEAWALTEASRRLLAAAQKPDDSSLLIAALQINQRLWTIFQTAMTEADCPLPPDLRENILVLSILVDRDTRARYADHDVTKLGRLIQINRSVAAGLSGGAASQPAACAPAPAAAPAGPPRPAVPAAAPRPAPAPLSGVKISV